MKLTAAERALVEKQRAAVAAEKKAVADARKLLSELSGDEAVALASQVRRRYAYDAHRRGCALCDDDDLCGVGRKLADASYFGDRY